MIGYTGKASNNKQNKVGTFLRLIGVFSMGILLIMAIFNPKDSYGEYSGTIFFAYFASGIITGGFFFGLSEIIFLLDKLVYGKPDSDEEEHRNIG